MWDPFSGTRNEKLKTDYEGNRTTYYYNELLRIAGPILMLNC